MLATIVIIITLVFCGLFFMVSWRVKDSAASSFAMYAIGGGALPLYLVLFSDIATIMGAGNFIGHAEHIRVYKKETRRKETRKRNKKEKETRHPLLLEEKKQDTHYFCPLLLCLNIWVGFTKRVLYHPGSETS